MATVTTEQLGRSSGDDRPDGSIRSLIPARLDRLGWSRFHTRLVIALGVAWVLDGLEITIASNAEGLISQKSALNLSSSEVAFAVGTVYLLGEVAGALFFGRMSDKFGRRNLFMITLGVYLFGGVMTALTLGHSQGWVYWVWVSRFIAGMGIGGEYAAINSAIDELIPAKYRGRVDIAVNGTYWGGARIATLFFIFVVNHLPVSYSWRVAFLVGPALGFVILFVRKNLPESPRWLLMHGREQEAESAVAEIESPLLARTCSRRSAPLPAGELEGWGDVIAALVCLAAEQMRRTFGLEEKTVGAVFLAPWRGGRRVARRP